MEIDKKIQETFENFRLMDPVSLEYPVIDYQEDLHKAFEDKIKDEKKKNLDIYIRWSITILIAITGIITSQFQSDFFIILIWSLSFIIGGIYLGHILTKRNLLKNWS